MQHTLSHLHLGRPGVRRPCLLTVLALRILHDELHLESLLQHRVVLHLLLHRQLQFNSARVGLCPNKLGVEQLYFLEALHVFETDGQ